MIVGAIGQLDESVFILRFVFCSVCYIFLCRICGLLVLPRHQIIQR
jgi:hypothetical protein